jgi:hypothetical protein
MLPTPNFITTEDYRFMKSKWTEQILPAGSFVRPIELCWLPKHILDADGHKWFNSETEVYAYCSWGIIAIPKKIMRKV